MTNTKETAIDMIKAKISLALEDQAHFRELLLSASAKIDGLRAALEVIELNEVQPKAKRPYKRKAKPPQTRSQIFDPLAPGRGIPE